MNRLLKWVWAWQQKSTKAMRWRKLLDCVRRREGRAALLSGGRA
jgi:hypothetical protein